MVFLNVLFLKDANKFCNLGKCFWCSLLCIFIDDMGFSWENIQSAIENSQVYNTASQSFVIASVNVNEGGFFSNAESQDLKRGS